MDSVSAGLWGQRARFLQFLKTLVPDEVVIMLTNIEGCVLIAILGGTV